MTYISDTSFYNPTIDGYDTETTGSDLDKDDFLNLLVTQLEYQNPLDPMDDTQFIAQLAQFSQLEALTNMSDSLETSSEVNYLMAQTITNTMATTLIGKDIVAEAANFTLESNGSEDLSFDLGADAETTVISIYDEDGDLVRTVTLDDLTEGMNTYTWDGTNDSGTSVSAGTYSYEVTATGADGTAIDVSNRVIGTIESVKYEDGTAYLIVGGYKVDLSTIIEVIQEGDEVSTMLVDED